MHELAVTENLLALALKHASLATSAASTAAAPPPRITCLHIVIGQLSSIIDDSVQFYWDIIAKDTPAQSARLDFQRIPALFQCSACSHQFAYRPDEFTCPACNDSQLKIIAGNEFYLDSIEIETS